MLDQPADERKDTQNKEEIDNPNLNKDGQLPIWKIVFATMWNAGVVFCFSAEFVFGTPQFQAIGVARFWTTFIWVGAGPAIGFLIQPIVGAYSDTFESRWGRRRPFVLLGMIVTIIGMFFFANPVSIGEYFGDVEGDRPVAKVVAILAVMIMNTGLNTIQATAWALVLDVTPRNQQKVANAILTAVASFFGVLAASLGFFDVVSVLTFFSSNGQAMMYIALLVEFLSTIPCILIIKEAPYRRPAGDSDVTGQSAKRTNVFVNMWITISRHTPLPVQRMLVVFFFSNACYAPFQFYFTDYIGSDVYHGDSTALPGTPAKDTYDEGVQYGSLCMSICMASSVVCALSVTPVQKKIGLKWTYFIGQTIGTAVLFLFFFQRLATSASVAVMAALLGTMYAVSNVVPYSILGLSVPKTQSGTFVGLMNVMQVLAQIAGILSAGLVTTLSKHVGYGLAVGSLYSLAGCIFIFRLIIPDVSEINETVPLMQNRDVTVSTA